MNLENILPERSQSQKLTNCVNEMPRTGTSKETKWLPGAGVVEKRRVTANEHQFLF